MCYFFIITVHKTYHILFIKRAYIYSFLIIKRINEVRILNYQHPSCLTLFYQEISQTGMVFLRKFILRIRAELAVVRRIQEHEIILCRLMFTQEILKIKKRMGAEDPKYSVNYEIGEVVSIVDGPFKGFEGTVSEIDTQKGKLKVMVSMFGRETPVELDALQVKQL